MTTPPPPLIVRTRVLVKGLLNEAVFAVLVLPDLTHPRPDLLPKCVPQGHCPPGLCQEPAQRLRQLAVLLLKLQDLTLPVRFTLPNRVEVAVLLLEVKMLGQVAPQRLQAG